MPPQDRVANLRWRQIMDAVAVGSWAESHAGDVHPILSALDSVARNSRSGVLAACDDPGAKAVQTLASDDPTRANLLLQILPQNATPVDLTDALRQFRGLAEKWHTVHPEAKGRVTVYVLAQPSAGRAAAGLVTTPAPLTRQQRRAAIRSLGLA